MLVALLPKFAIAKNMCGHKLAIPGEKISKRAVGDPTIKHADTHARKRLRS